MANRTPGVTEKLLETAMQEFLSCGYRNASLRTIAEIAGTSPRAVYTRYSDKEGLFAALVSEQAETLKSMFRRYMADYHDKPVDEQKQLFHDEAFDSEYQGYIEASIKLPKGKGTWPAFWMMPVNFKSWPADGEIDIMEEVGGHANYVSSSLHANAHVHSNGTQVTHEMYLEGAEDDFHTYAILWTHDNITTYVDGQVQLSYDNKGLGRDDWPYDDPFYVIFNLAWGGSWGGTYGIDESALPCTMEIDYIRVFQK